MGNGEALQATPQKIVNPFAFANFTQKKNIDELAADRITSRLLRQSHAIWNHTDTCRGSIEIIYSFQLSDRTTIAFALRSCQRIKQSDQRG
ncbi:hypothetical protein X551_01750 [Methylibium sp. T29]|nr:hypothetical protein X551_01750 [Methylibium sp. T29]